jgi:DNA polymerase III delta prime subunit
MALTKKKEIFRSRLFGQDSIFNSIRESFHDIPHLLITGPPGCGKTTFLEDFITLCKREAPFTIESVLYLSSEKDRGIHTIRDRVTEFCKRALSKPNSLRWIVIDDADTLPLISQQALRRPMEQHFHLTRFIFASRYASNLIEPLKSRCQVLELEPISPFDSYPLLLDHFKIPLSHRSDELQQFFISSYINIIEQKNALKIFIAYMKEGLQTQEILTKLKSYLPKSTKLIHQLIISLQSNNYIDSANIIKELYFCGYLLDDILLGIEKGIFLFPATVPEARFRILKFTMQGWIYIQQGKEHWFDTMEVLSGIFLEPGSASKG